MDFALEGVQNPENFADVICVGPLNRHEGLSIKYVHGIVKPFCAPWSANSYNLYDFVCYLASPWVGHIFLSIWGVSVRTSYIEVAP